MLVSVCADRFKFILADFGLLPADGRTAGQAANRSRVADSSPGQFNLKLVKLIYGWDDAAPISNSRDIVSLKSID
jgi:hypothetical protein